MRAEFRFRVMGTNAHVLVLGGAPNLAGRAHRRLAELERRWSRFLPTSELSSINAGVGRAVHVSGATTEAVRLAVEAWHATGGLFDPTTLPALVGAGYDRSFEDVTSTDAPPDPPAPSPGCDGIEVDVERSTVLVPPCVQLDLGGIGKGLAADIVARELLDIGARGALVNVGGDVRVVGESPDEAGWVIRIADPTGRGGGHLVAITEGAVATSSTLRRSWERCGRTMHHVIDPRTGRPAATGLFAVSVVTGEAWWAEVLAKAVLVSGETEGRELLRASGAAGVLTGERGILEEEMGAYLR